MASTTTVKDSASRDIPPHKRIDMTSKERLLTAFRRGIPDHVPVCPDFSVMLPARLTGRPFYELFLDGEEHTGWTSETFSKAYVDAVRYFGIDGWYLYGGLKELTEKKLHEEIVEISQGRTVKRWIDTPKGRLTEEEIFFSDEPSWKEVKVIKDLKADFERFLLWKGKDWKWENEFRDRDRIGDDGVFAGGLPLFQDWWFDLRQGGFQQMFVDFTEEGEFMERVYDFYTRWGLAYVDAMVRAKPDEIFFGGAASSLSCSSPKFFLKYDVPFLQKGVKIAHDGGILTHLHVCGKSLGLAEIVCDETDVDVMEPLEEPPGGDVDLAEAKKRFGKKICIKGNINTFDFLLNATVDEVKEKAKRCIDATAEGGGYVLSTGDQCGRDTPLENIFALVEVAKTYGRY